jgi:hypothetical protein
MRKIILLNLIAFTSLSFGQDMSLIKAKLETGYYINTNIISGEETPIILTFILRGERCKAFGIGASTQSMIKMNRGKIKLTNGYCQNNKFKFTGYFYDKNKMFGAKGKREEGVLTIPPQLGFFSIKNIRKDNGKEDLESDMLK